MVKREGIRLSLYGTWYKRGNWYRRVRKIFNAVISKYASEFTKTKMAQAEAKEQQRLFRMAEEGVKERKRLRGG